MMIATLVLAAATFSLSGTAQHAFVVWVGGPAPAPTPGSFSMRNVNRTFSPGAIVVPVGSEVRFPNDDPFEHSIYATDPLNAFDIGYYGTGPGKFVTFSHPGVVHVRCHIHSYMHGMIVVAGGPYTQVLGGSYRIDNLPAGTYTVHVVSDDGTERTERIQLNADKTLDY